MENKLRALGIRTECLFSGNNKDIRCCISSNASKLHVLFSVDLSFLFLVLLRRFRFFLPEHRHDRGLDLLASPERLAVTHISRCQLKGKSYLPVEDGEDIIFAYAGSKQRNKQARLLRLFLRKESFMDEQYPKLSTVMKHFKDTEGGQGKVCKSIELYAKEYASEKSLTYVKALMDKLDFSLEKTMDALKLSNDEKTYVLNNIQK